MLLVDPADIALFMRAKSKVRNDLSKKLIHITKLLLGLRKREGCPECGSKEFYRQASLSEEYTIYSDGHLILHEAGRDWDNYTCHDCEYED